LNGHVTVKHLPIYFHGPMARNLAKASQAPVIVALLVLMSLSLFGLAVAWWPEERAGAEVRELRNQAVPPSPASFGGDCFALPPDRPQPKWM
jgi:hypothetical protein